MKADFTDPALLGFCGALPVGMTLVAGGLGPYAPGFASALWWAGCLLLTAFQVWGIGRWLAGQVPLDKLNAGWLILIVGGIVVPGPGVSPGHAEAARFFFGFSACGATILLPLLLARAALAAPLPEALRPTWFILLVPPSLIYANGLALIRRCVSWRTCSSPGWCSPWACSSSRAASGAGRSARRGGPSPSRSTRLLTPPRATRRSIPRRRGRRSPA